MFKLNIFVVVMTGFVSLISQAEVCTRHPAIIRALELDSGKSCAEINSSDLASVDCLKIIFNNEDIGYLDLKNIPFEQNGYLVDPILAADFQGLINLVELKISSKAYHLYAYFKSEDKIYKEFLVVRIPTLDLSNLSKKLRSFSVAWVYIDALLGDDYRSLGRIEGYAPDDISGLDKTLSPIEIREMGPYNVLPTPYEYHDDFNRYKHERYINKYIAINPFPFGMKDLPLMDDVKYTFKYSPSLPSLNLNGKKELVIRACLDFG